MSLHIASMTTVPQLGTVGQIALSLAPPTEQTLDLIALEGFLSGLGVLGVEALSDEHIRYIFDPVNGTQRPNNTEALQQLVAIELKHYSHEFLQLIVDGASPLLGVTNRLELGLPLELPHWFLGFSLAIRQFAPPFFMRLHHTMPTLWQSLESACIHAKPSHDNTLYELLYCMHAVLEDMMTIVIDCRLQ